MISCRSSSLSFHLRAFWGRCTSKWRNKINQSDRFNMRQPPRRRVEDDDNNWIIGAILNREHRGLIRHSKGWSCVQGGRDSGMGDLRREGRRNGRTMTKRKARQMRDDAQRERERESVWIQLKFSSLKTERPRRVKGRNEVVSRLCAKDQEGGRGEGEESREFD